MPNRSILLVDDDETFARSLRRALAHAFDVRHAGSGSEALRQLSPLPDAVLLDIRLSDDSADRQGIALLETLKREHPSLPVLMITGFGDIDTAVECVRLGATDFLEKRGVNAAEISTRLDQAIERVRLQSRVQQLEEELRLVEPRTLIGESAAIGKVRELALSAATDGTVSVLLRGETGTGKELVARAIHASGPRSKGPFVALSLFALPAQTVESELFGHEAGAFTDARQRYIGYIERAHSGVLVLDEIGEIDAALQVKLLRFLEEREFYRLGGTAPVKVDVQIVAATNADLEGMVREKRFRDDLYFRLKVREITVPPLRERREDVPLLARHFLVALRPRGRRVLSIAPEAERMLAAFDWPGNVRQLRNVIESAVLDAEMNGRDRIEAVDLHGLGISTAGSAAPSTGAASHPGDPGFSLDETLARVELRLVDEALRASGDRITHAWKLLGANDRFVLSRRIRRLLATHQGLRAEFPRLVERFVTGRAPASRGARAKSRRRSA